MPRHGVVQINLTITGGEKEKAFLDRMARRWAKDTGQRPRIRANPRSAYLLALVQIDARDRNVRIPGTVPDRIEET